MYIYTRDNLKMMFYYEHYKHTLLKVNTEQNLNDILRYIPIDKNMSIH